MGSGSVARRASFPEDMVTGILSCQSLACNQGLSMNNEADFVEEIRKTPGDLTPRLIYADFLEDRGDPHGEFIRVQCELSEMPTGTPGRSELMNRERELLETFGDEWLQPLKQLGVRGLTFRSFERGLLERIRISAVDYLHHWKELFELVPALQCLELRNLRDLHDDQFQQLNFPDQLVALDVSSGKLTGIQLQRLTVPLSLAESLTTIDVSGNPLNSDALSVLRIPQVRRLKAANCSITGDSLAGWFQRNSSASGSAVDILRSLFVTASRLTSRITELDLRGNALGPQGYNTLADQIWPELRHLDISSCGLAAIGRLANEEHFPSLKGLVARNNRLTDLDRLSAEQQIYLRQLSILDLRPHSLP